MKCEECGGTGKVQKWFYERTGFGKYEKVCEDVKCEWCNGTGEVEQTEQEWLQTATTEQLAEWIISLCVTYFDRTDLSIVGAVKESLKINDHYDGHIQKDLLVEWLKQPHSEVGK